MSLHGPVVEADSAVTKEGSTRRSTAAISKGPKRTMKNSDHLDQIGGVSVRLPVG